ncbi:zinc ribbon domain-containing protein [Chelatococcus asaccharovorans]
MECPRCAETIKRAAKICRFCGFELGPAPNGERSATVT